MKQRTKKGRVIIHKFEEISHQWNVAEQLEVQWRKQSYLHDYTINDNELCVFVETIHY